jgi:hypothetical protein
MNKMRRSLKRGIGGKIFNAKKLSPNLMKSLTLEYINAFLAYNQVFFQTSYSSGTKSKLSFHTSVALKIPINQKTRKLTQIIFCSIIKTKGNV